MNGITLHAELLAIVVILRRRLLITGLLVYTLLHVITFALTGMLFWKWIWLNASLLLALRFIPAIAFPRILQILLLLLVTLGNQVFVVSEDGSYKHTGGEHREALRRDPQWKDGRRPQQLFPGGIPAVRPDGICLHGGAPASRQGLWELPIREKRCATPMDAPCNQIGYPDKAHSVSRQLERFVQDHHAYVLQRVGSDGKLFYDVHPHHIWSMPSEFREFYQLDKRDHHRLPARDPGSLPRLSGRTSQQERPCRADARDSRLTLVSTTRRALRLFVEPHGFSLLRRSSIGYEGHAAVAPMRASADTRLAFLHGFTAVASCEGG